MLSIKHIVKGFSINNITHSYQLFHILRFSSSLLIGILLVKWGFDREQTSLYESFIFSINIFSFFWIAAFSNSMLSMYSKMKIETKKSFIATNFLIFQSFSFIAGLIFYISGGLSIMQSAQISNSPNLVNLVSICLIFYPTGVLAELYYIIKDKSKTLAQYGLLSYLALIIIIVLSLSVFGTLDAVIKGFVVWGIIRWAWTLKLILPDLDFKKYNSGIYKEYIWITAPLLLHFILSNGSEYIDGIIVKSYFSTDQFSFYRYGAREFPFLMVIIGALRSTMIHRGSSNTDSMLEEMKSETRKISLIFFPASLLLLFISKPLFVLFYNPDYAQSALLFNIYLLLVISRIIVAEVMLYNNRKNTMFALISLIELIVNVLLSIVLLRYFGIYGIAIATLVAFTISKIYLIYYVNKKFAIKMSRYIDIKTFTVLSLILLTGFVISYIIYFK